MLRTRQAVAAVDISEKHAAPAHMSIDPLNNEGQVARLNEPSMAFSLDQMVDSLVGHAGEDEEEFVFTGRRNR